MQIEVEENIIKNFSRTYQLMYILSIINFKHAYGR